MRYFASALAAACAAVVFSPPVPAATPCNRCAGNAPATVDIGNLSIASVAAFPGAQSTGPQAAATTQPAAPQAVGFNPCCTPWNADQLRAHLYYNAGTNPIPGKYTVKFVPSTQLNAQITSYLLYVGTLGPSNPSLRIVFTLYRETSPGSGTFSSITSSTVDWFASGGPNPAPNFFSNTLMDANVLYRVETSVTLFNAPASFVLQQPCVTTHVDILVQA